MDLSLIGFGGLSPSARLAEQSNMSLDFLDDNHILLTFNPKKMFTRLPDCPPAHDDRIIHAAVLEVPDGKVVKEADWYLHDHRRYFWALGSGRFLLRRLNSLYLVDSDLHEKLLLTSPRPFLWISVTADSRQIIVERGDGPPAKAKDPAKPAKPTVKIEFLDVDSLAVQRVIKSEGVVNLEALSSGFANVIHSKIGKVWLVRFGPSGRERENVTRVRSRCVPDIVFSSGNTVLVGRCAMNSSEYSVSAFTVTGHLLWRQHWSGHRYTPKVRRSEEGSRIAVSSIARVVLDAASAEDDANADADRGLRQHVQVLDTASGSAVLSLEVAQPSLAAQNIALAPAGRRLALLQGSTLALYELPEMSREERAKYEGVKADVPGLYTVAAEPTPTGAAPEETTFAAIDAAEEATPANEPAEAQAGGEPSANEPAQAAAVAPTQETKKTEAEMPATTLRATARIVVEDVVVIDSKGRPVKGLPEQAFQLMEDGKVQNVRSFEEYPKTETSPVMEKVASAPGNSTPTPAPQEAPKLPPNIYTNNSSKGSETGSATIIVLDLLNTPLQDQQRAKDQLITFIKNRPEASQMALCSLGSNLRLIQGFTHDDNVLIAAVNGKKGGVKAPPWQSDTGLEKSVQLARDAALQIGPGALMQLQIAQNAVDEQKAQDVDTRMRFTMDAFMQLARYLSGVPGRKNLVWLSGSFPLNIFPNPDVNLYQPVTRNYETEVRKVTNLLAEAHVAVYPVSVKGIETQTMYAAANNGTYEPRAFAGQNVPNNPGSGTALLANTSANLPLSSRMDRETREFRETVASEQSAMDQVATDTGGKAFYNSNGIEDAIKTAVDEGSHYYTLSYTPTNRKYDGGFRKIKVALAQKGYHLAYRRGYYGVDPDLGSRDTRAPAQRIGVAAMQQGAPQSRQIVFATRVVPIGKPKKVDAAQAGMAARPKKKGAPAGPVEMQHYGIDYAITPSDLRFSASAAGLYHSALGFMVTAFNDDGRMVASLVSTATSDLKPANYKDVMTGGFRLHQELDVPTEAVSLRLGVEDATTSHVGTMEIALPVPVPPELPKVATRSLPPIEPD